MSKSSPESCLRLNANMGYSFGISKLIRLFFFASNLLSQNVLLMFALTKDTVAMKQTYSDERKRLLNRAYTRIYVSMCEIHNILELDDAELDKADRHTHAAAMRALRIPNAYQFEKLCKSRGIPDGQKWLTSADIFAMSASYETFKIFMSLPEKKLTLLEQLLRQTYPEAYL